MTDRTTAQPLSEAEEAKALDIARRLIKAGVPIFAAPPDGARPGHFIFPKAWEKTYPTETWLERWKPGWALAAVGGHVCDFLDVDPRSGGLESEKEVRGAGQWPRSFGRQTTPSGGTHDLISATGERKATGFMPGLDLQAGAPDGQGRGFVWISPTVRPSKDPDHLGELVPYRWVEEPDLDHLAEYRSATGAVTDDTLDGLLSRVHAARSRVPLQRAERAAQPASPDDPFMTASGTSAGGSSGGERTFTMSQAMDFIRPHLVDLQRAQVGSIEDRANTAAAALSHFVPTFWTVDQAYALLVDALGHTAYDPDGPGEWRAEKFIRVLDGSRPPLDPWRAMLTVEAPAPPPVMVEAGPGEAMLTTVEKLRRKLMSADDLAAAPNPEPLIQGLLDLDTESWLIGAPGSLKSFIALDMAAHVGTGMPWQGHRVHRGPVLYLAAEGTRGMVLRTRAWQKVHGTMAGVTFLPYPVKVQSNDGQWAALVEIAQELKPAMIVIDTQARVTVGLEENSAKDMGIFTDAVGALKRATGACVLVVHHTGRNGGDARGSSALDGAQDTELKVVRASSGKKGPRPLICKLVQDKQKDMAEGDGDGLELVLAVEKLGEDPTTGRELSSLVLLGRAAAEYELAQGSDELEDEDLVKYKGRQPAEWTARVPGVASQAKLKRRILQAIHDHAHSRGLTRADAEKVVTARWGKPGDQRHWISTWNEVVSLDLVVNVSGERFALDPLEVAALVTPEDDGQ